MRLDSKIADSRLSFILNPKKFNEQEFTTEDLKILVANLLSYNQKKSNVTILDLSGVPFEVLSLVVSLVTRLVFSFSFHLRRSNTPDISKCPILLVYEEAHTYAPRNASARYNSARQAIERVAKEGRKYGISLMIVSQRPSEISETIFSQCNNFVAMRLTNPTDQSYVQRLLPDDLGRMSDSLATLEQRHALVIGDALPLPSLIRVDHVDNLPSSTDIPVLREWRKDWLDLDFSIIAKSLTD